MKKIPSSLIEQCENLEKRLRRYRLWGNLVPSGTWGESLYKIMSRREWDIVRKAAYAHYNNKCAICAQDNITLYGHEDWRYDYDNSIQQLNSVLALCNLCHMCNHLGFAGIQAEQGRLNYSELINHWCSVNSASVSDFEEHREDAFKLWKLRGKFEWKVVDSTGNEITSNLSSSSVLKGLWNE